MSSQQKRGFRLPWAAEQRTDEGAAAATLEAESSESAEPTTPDRIEDGVGDDIGEGPFHLAEGSTPDASTDASPEAPEVPEITAEAAMIESETPTTELPEAAPPTTDHAWPDSDQGGTAADPAKAASEDTALPSALPPLRVEGDTRSVRANPLVAGLVKAMREAALASRSETTTRLQAEASARVEEIRSTATEQSAALRKRVDEDIAAIRDWSKGEMARIRHETEERIETRRTEAVAETNRHTAHIETLVEQVQGRVEAFEADMDRFFERLLAENDPATLASLAEQAPEPPDLAVDLSEPEPAPATTGDAWNDVAWGGGETTAGEADIPAAASLETEAAAAAEAASTEGLEMPKDDVWPTSVIAAARRAVHHEPAHEFEAAGVANTRLFVNGLASVAGISSFKGALSQISGVRSVSVSSGEPGVFIFTVVHSPETDMQAALAGLTAFSARVTEASGDTLTVAAHEPAA